LFARMRIAPKPLDPDEVMEIDFSCRRIKGKQHVSGETFIHTEIKTSNLLAEREKARRKDKRRLDPASRTNRSNSSLQ
jgi:hypothetical protein